MDVAAMAFIAEAHISRHKGIEWFLTDKANWFLVSIGLGFTDGKRSMDLEMNTEKRSSIKMILTAALFCWILSIGTVCFADEKGTVTVESAKIRESADTNSNQVGSVPKGGTVDIIGETTGTDGKIWYQVFVDANKKGYIRADLIEKSSGGNANASGNANAGSSTPAPTTSTDSKRGTVVNNNVRIRKGASLSDDVVATANRGMVVTVVGETAASDGSKWYQVSFPYNNNEITGYIRSDLVTFDNVPADPAVSEITGEPNTEAPAVPETQAQPEEPAEPVQQNPSSGTQGVVYMNVEETPYVMPGFDPVLANWGTEQINAYRNGNFFIIYARMQNGEEGWFLFDQINETYLRYVYTAEDEGVEVKIPGGMIVTGDIMVIVALGVVIVILLAIIALMFLKMRGNSGGYDEYEDEEEDGAMDDLEEEYAEQAPSAQMMRRSPVRRPVSDDREQPPVRRAQNVQPMRRPSMSMSSSMPSMQEEERQPREQQPMRRMPSQTDGEVTVRRRPEMDSRSINGQGGRYAEQPGNRRQTGAGQPQRNMQKAPQQNGYKTRPSSDNDDDLEYF